MVTVFCVESCIFDLGSENGTVGRRIGHDRTASDSGHEKAVYCLENGKKT